MYWQWYAKLRDFVHHRCSICFKSEEKKRIILTQNQFANRRVRQIYFQSAALLFFTVDEDESRQKII